MENASCQQNFRQELAENRLDTRFHRQLSPAEDRFPIANVKPVS